jgi:hypothetical protein
MRWAGALVGEERKLHRFLVDKSEERNLLSDRDVHGRMGSEWILGRLTGRMLLGFNWLRIGTGGACCECGDKPSSSDATELIYRPIQTNTRNHENSIV